jgi:hypothetical protein
MKLAIMQPYLFPYIGYFQLINAVDTFVILDDVNYINRGWINRNKILINGQEKLFTVPLSEASQNKRINEIQISTADKWKGKLLKSIEYNYSKAPLFYNAFPVIQKIILNPDLNLSSFVHFSLIEISNYLTIKTNIIPSSSAYQNTHLRAQDRILDICMKERATVYINLQGGINLYSRDKFFNHNISLFFLKASSLVYKQFNNDFLPNLSIIDLMMFNNPESMKDILSEYELI